VFPESIMFREECSNELLSRLSLLFFFLGIFEVCDFYTIIASKYGIKADQNVLGHIV
jgi:hypothetical protein